MKNLIMMSLLLTMVACNGGGSSSSSEGEADPFDNDGSQCYDGNGVVVSCTPPTSDLIIEYNSYGVYQANGISLDLMGTYDENRAITIPQFITIVQDTNNSIRLNDVVRIKFVDTTCSWVYTAPDFEFYNCSGLLSSAQHGDTIYLSDLYNSLNPNRAGKIDFGVQRDPSDNHTGTIVIRANLGQ